MVLASFVIESTIGCDASQVVTPPEVPTSKAIELTEVQKAVAETRAISRDVAARFEQRNDRLFAVLNAGSADEERTDSTREVLLEHGTGVPLQSRNFAIRESSFFSTLPMIVSLPRRSIPFQKFRECVVDKIRVPLVERSAQQPVLMAPPVAQVPRASNLG